MNKYRNQPVVIDGVRFASKAEGRRYLELKLLERAGEIRGLELQPKYVMLVAGKRICSYSPDFRYVEKGAFVCEDVKGRANDRFPIKAKLFRALYPDVELRVIRA